MARCAGGAGRLARHAGAILAAARRLLFAPSEGRFGRGAEIGGLLVVSTGSGSDRVSCRLRSFGEENYPVATAPGTDLERVGREQALELWKQYPIMDYGKKWDTYEPSNQTSRFDVQTKTS